ncbi:MAG: hypothetical protein ACYTDY_11445, partial [Planctomycetota bacterium]
MKFLLALCALLAICQPIRAREDGLAVLVRRLDSDSPRERFEAQRELEEVARSKGEQIAPALKAAVANAGPEGKRALGILLDRLPHPALLPHWDVLSIFD